MFKYLQRAHVLSPPYLSVLLSPHVLILMCAFSITHLTSYLTDLLEVKRCKCKFYKWLKCFKMFTMSKSKKYFFFNFSFRFYNTLTGWKLVHRPKIECTLQVGQNPNFLSFPIYNIDHTALIGIRCRKHKKMCTGWVFSFMAWW